ncbi:hypothetical protein K469DRAFT_723092 [Zopfia rhizophila CBS 207.26]|uniref:Uncharacterized protein n=1 Tax=Zopfia rhizophila CBS 207.26 TaxID=1314779 RepID=A0A6A6EK07_9PEZI|nr:hypothetical protein K469DRAFT_723092 [Zopfia rhizophila CBS 207.26]
MEEMSNPISLSSSQASSQIPTHLRNNIYSALLSSGGIPAIQSTLTHELQASGWTTNLRSYITQLLRTGECTTVGEVMERVMSEAQLGGHSQKSNGMTNGVNGVNGYKETEEVNLRIPERAVREGVRVVRRELEKVCDITVEGEEK